MGSGLVISRLRCAASVNRRGDRVGRRRIRQNSDFGATGAEARALRRTRADEIGCSLVNGITRKAILAHGAITGVLSKLHRSGVCVFGRGPRRFVSGIIELVGRRGTAVVMSRVSCSRADNACSGSVFATRGDGRPVRGTFTTGGTVRSCIFASNATRRDVREHFTRSLSGTRRIYMCTGLPGKFRVPAPINGCSPS